MKTIKLSLGIFIALNFAACSSNRQEEVAESADSVATYENNVTDLQGTEAKLVKTADIDFKVKDAYKTSQHIYSAVKDLGGLVTHNDIKTNQLDSKSIPASGDSIQVISSFEVNAEMMVRVPSVKLDEFVRVITADATFIATAKLDVDDRSIDFLSTEQKQKARQNIISKELKKDSLKTDDALMLANQQDQVIEQKMNNLRTDANVRYSTISLHFTQNNMVKKETLPNNDLSSYQAPASKRFTDALYSGLMFCVDILIALTHLWAFILLGLAGWFGYRYWAKRNTVKGQA